MTSVFRKILVIGSGGAGKSTFATHLGAILGIPVVHLDVLFWKPGWVESPTAEWEETVTRTLQAESWIMDGNYGGTLERRLQAADAVVFLDLPRRLCLWRALKRLVRYYHTTRPDVPDGCVERFDFAFLRWLWNFPTETRPQVVELLEAELHRGKAIVLHRPAEVAKFLADVREAGFAVALAAALRSRPLR